MTTATKPEEQQDLDINTPIPAGAMVLHSEPVMQLASPQEVQAMIRQRDEQAMMASFAGEVISSWFYEFKIGGKTVEGVGVVGAEEFARIRAEQGYPITYPFNGVRIAEDSLNGEIGVRATIVARDQRTGAEAIGTAFYPHYAKRRDGSHEFDDKADRKALSVAKRNAILDLVPQAMILTILKARKQLIASNETRIKNQERVALGEQIANAPEPRRVRAAGREQAKADAVRTDVYAGKTSGDYVMTIGKKKGTPMRDIDTEDLVSTMKWCRETDEARFADLLAKIEIVLEDRNTR